MATQNRISYLDSYIPTEAECEHIHYLRREVDITERAAQEARETLVEYNKLIRARCEGVIARCQL